MLTLFEALDVGVTKPVRFLRTVATTFYSVI